MSLKSVCSLCFVQCLPVSMSVMVDISWSFVFHTPSSICLPSESSFLTQGFHCLFMLTKYFDCFLFHPIFSSLAIYSLTLLPHHSFLPFRLKKNILLWISLVHLWNSCWFFSGSLPHYRISIHTCLLLYSTAPFIVILVETIIQTNCAYGTECKQSCSHIIKIPLPVYFFTPPLLLIYNCKSNCPCFLLLLFSYGYYFNNNLKMLKLFMIVLNLKGETVNGSCPNHCSYIFM